MNTTRRQESFSDAFIKNFITIFLGVVINSINGSFVYIYFKNQVFRRDPRYVLYIHLVINDIIMLNFSVFLQLLTYITSGQLHVTFCCVLLVVMITTNKNSPLNLAGMAVERYIAVCRPLYHTQICTVRRAYSLITLIWAVSFIVAFTDIVILFITQPLSFFSVTRMCFADGIFFTHHHKAKTTAMQVLLVSMVFLTLVFTYLKVLFAARMASSANKASARRARNTILLHGVQLLLCMLSYFSPIITMHVVVAFPSNMLNVIYTTFLLTNILPRLLSPLIYGVRDQKLNSHMRLCFCCRGVQLLWAGGGGGGGTEPDSGRGS